MDNMKRNNLQNTSLYEEQISKLKDVIDLRENNICE